MGKMEIEVKVLNINVNEVRSKIIAAGGIELEKINQKLFTYDLPSIHGRYSEILWELNHPSTPEKLEIDFARMKKILFEIENIEHVSIVSIRNQYDVVNLVDILNKSNCMEILNSDTMIDFVQTLGINGNKWIRLRESGNTVTLAVKHILLDNGSKIQQLLETEIEVTGFEETNDLLLQLGFVHKSYQEKKRIRFMLRKHEIDIDFWPGIPPFMEVEGTSEDDIDNLLNCIGFTLMESVSCTADDIYRMNGKNMFSSRELRFETSPIGF